MDMNALYKISYGIYIVSSMKGGRRNGLISTTVFQTTAQPPTVTASINKQSLTHEYIEHSGVFGVSILSRETPMKFIGTFGFRSGRDIDKFEGVEYTTGVTGAPIVLENAVAYLEAKVVNSLDLGTHTLFVGEVAGAETLNDSDLMTYAYYHDVKHGRSPEAAPTFIKKTEINVEKYRCIPCGYIYDPAEGDSDGGIAPGTPFDDLPEDWVCPMCGAEKSQFERV